jgi:hypothetical protein
MIKYYVAKQTVKSALDAIDFARKSEQNSCEAHFGSKVYLVRKLRHKDAKFNYNNLEKFFPERVIFNGAKIYKTASQDLWIYFPTINELWSVYRYVGTEVGK